MDLKIKILQDEYWWGGAVADGWKMPISAESDYHLDCTINATYNQFNGLFVSNFGRYIYFDGGAEIKVSDGELSVLHTESDIRFGEGYGDLRSVMRFLAKEFFSSSKPFGNLDYLIEPQYCTWSEMLTNPTSEKLVSYAHSIREKGLNGKVIILDDGWSYDYGDWRFNKEKFPNPKETIERLKELGFSVMLWVVPFVNLATPDFQTLKKNGALVMQNDEVFETEWWNGKSAVLDMSKAAAVEWIKSVLDNLVNTYGVVGFKFDAGDAMYYPSDGRVSPNRQSELWAEFADQYDYVELRACVGMGGKQIAQRLSDKCISWDERGLKSLIPNIIQAGLCGYYYNCGDMVGGGQSADYEKLSNFDYEFYIRSCQIATLFPIVQFSYSIWNKEDRLKEAAITLCKTRSKFNEYFRLLINRAMQENEPIVRNLEYEFPKQGLANEKGAFTLGEKYLVCPIVEKGQREKIIRFPQGANWRSLEDGRTFIGGQTVAVTVDLTSLPVFERICLTPGQAIRNS